MSTANPSTAPLRTLSFSNKLFKELNDAITNNVPFELETALVENSPEEQDRILGKLIQASCSHNRPQILHTVLGAAIKLKPSLPHAAAAFKAVGEDGSTPLIIALRNHRIDIIDLLVENKLADPEIADKRGKNALMYCHSAEAVEKILAIDQDKNLKLVNHQDKRGATSLMLVLEQSGDVNAASQLMNLVADVDAADNEGRTALTTAIWKDRKDIVRELAKRTDVKSMDKRHRNPFHHLAERPTGSITASDEEIFDILLKTNFDINATDWFGRTPLAVSLISGKPNLSLLFMATVKCEIKEDFQTKAGWALLHLACGSDRNNREVVKSLIAKGLDVTKRTRRSRKTVLHIAAQSGNVDVLKYLLESQSVSHADRDAYGNTPLFCITSPHSKRRAEIGALLAPWSKLTKDLLAKQPNHGTIREAAEEWKATIIDFNPGGSDPLSRKAYTIDDLIHRSNNDVQQEEPYMQLRPEEAPFRWIHVPANNITWCRDLITKVFVETGCEDVKGFRELERSLNNQHKGQQYHLHSRYMTPTCQAVHSSSSTYAHGVAAPSGVGSQFDDYAAADNQAWRGSGAMPLDANDPLNLKGGFVRVASPLQEPKDPLEQGISLENTESAKGKGHAFMFMPYLHHEKFDNMLAMERELDEIILREDLDPKNRFELKHRAPTSRGQRSIDNMYTKLHRGLLQAHLHKDNFTLHIRRTLDQFFYHNLTTKRRDRDQVVYRYQRKQHSPDPEPKILMVDQFWMWVIGDNLIITSFPCCWTGSDDDSSDMFENVIESVTNSSTESFTNIYQLAMAIASRFQGTHEGQGFSSDEPRALEMFSAEIGDAMDHELKLFREFLRIASKGAGYDDPARLAEALTYGEFYKSFLYIREETGLLMVVKDIRDELGMLQVLFEYQKHVVQSFQAAVESMTKQQPEDKAFSQLIVDNFAEQGRNIDRPLASVQTMDKQAERLYESVQDLLNLKQQHVNAVEARYARDQATSATRTGEILMVFTTVTIFFLPLSLIAAVFAIPMGVFKRRGNDGDGLAVGYVLKFMFGIGLPWATVVFVLAILGPNVTRQGTRFIVNKLVRKSPKTDGLRQWAVRNLRKRTMERRRPVEGEVYSMDDMVRPRARKRRDPMDYDSQ